MLVFFFVNIAFSRPSARPFRKSLIDMTSHPRRLGAGHGVHAPFLAPFLGDAGWFPSTVVLRSSRS